MVQPFGFVLGMLAIPALVIGMNLTGGGHVADAGNVVEYERLAFEMPEGAEYDRERTLEGQLPDGLGRFQFTPQDLYEQIQLPGKPEYDRPIEVDGVRARDIALSGNGQYLRVVVLEGGGVFSMGSTLQRRAEADRAFDEVIESVDVR